MYYDNKGINPCAVRHVASIVFKPRLAYIFAVVLPSQLKMCRILPIWAVQISVYLRAKMFERQRFYDTAVGK
jgi:hypothetical protein